MEGDGGGCKGENGDLVSSALEEESTHACATCLVDVHEGHSAMCWLATVALWTDGCRHDHRWTMRARSSAANSRQSSARKCPRWAASAGLEPLWGHRAVAANRAVKKATRGAVERAVSAKSPRAWHHCPKPPGMAHHPTRRAARRMAHNAVCSTARCGNFNDRSGRRLYRPAVDAIRGKSATECAPERLAKGIGAKELRPLAADAEGMRARNVGIKLVARWVVGVVGPCRVAIEVTHTEGKT